MKIDKELEMAFIRAIQKKRHDRTKMEETYIRKRNSYIDSQFELTPSVSEKIILLNEKLRAEEIRIFDQYRLIEKNCNLMLKNKITDGFNMHFELSLFNNKHYKKYEPSLYGNSFFEHVEDFVILQCVEFKYNFKFYNEFLLKFYHPLSP